MYPGFRVQSGGSFRARAESDASAKYSRRNASATGFREESRPFWGPGVRENEAFGGNAFAPAALLAWLDELGVDISAMDFDVSADATTIAFATKSSLVVHDLNDLSDVYLYDSLKGTFSLVSETPRGDAGMVRVCGRALMRLVSGLYFSPMRTIWWHRIRIRSRTCFFMT